VRVVGHALAALSALAALPVGAGALLVRPRWWLGLPERLGRQPRLAPGSVWIHAAAMGEMRSVSRLVELLLGHGRAVCTTATNGPGRELMRRARPDLPCHFAPLDHPWCVELALARVAPAALVFVETELWPSWIAGAQRRGIPAVVVSGRISDRSFPRYRHMRRIMEPALRRLHAVGARSEVDAERFRALGAAPERVVVTGDLKLDVDEGASRLAPDLERLLGEAPLLVAGSTRSGEEPAVLDAFEAAEREGLALSLVLVPRHPERAPEVERLLRERGRRWRRRTQAGETPLAAGEVLLVDTVGELAALYGCADVAFVGGTLVPVGGHNLLEPAAVGRPVLFGPHTANARHAVGILEDCGAGRCVADAARLAEAVVEWLGDRAAARARGERGRQALLAHRGSAERSQALIEAAIAAAPVS
jgi:3-deoxy-D-manno-octulosonic-acid transferase